MYADDTHITFASNNIQNINTVLNEDLARFEKWLTAYKLTLNASKTDFLLIGSRQRLSSFNNPPSLMIDGAPITQVTSTKSLSVHIYQTLSWNVHVENLCKKIGSGMEGLKRVRFFVPHEILRSIFIQNINTVLNEDLARVEKWLTAYKLTLNASKTNFLLIGSRQRLSSFHNPPSLMIDGAPITQVTSTKSLSVHIYQTLSWNVHVENLCKKIGSGIGGVEESEVFRST